MKEIAGAAELVADETSFQIDVVNRRLHSQPRRWCNGDVTPVELRHLRLDLYDDCRFRDSLCGLYFHWMRLLAFILVAVQLCATLAAAQSSDCASVSRIDKHVVLRANSWDPVYDLAATLVYRYGINVSVESPQWAFPGDTEDVAIADPQFSAQHENIHYLIMKRHAVEVRFPAVDATPNDVSGLLLQVAEAANKEMPYFYRVDAHDNQYVLVPTRTLTSAGELKDVQPLLDRHVSISAASRTIAEHARLLADHLSEKTGLNISCCQMLVSGVPWGLAKVSFRADDEPAREVLRRLIRLEQQENSQAPNRHPNYDHWTVSCDGSGAPWCFIEVRGRLAHQCR